jgi:hypothetical protein
MKNCFTILSVICVFWFTSCQTKSTTITDVSPNKKVNITIKASRVASLDPWKVEMDVKAYEFKEGHLTFELQTGEISDKTVKFDWKDDRNCTISMNQADGKPRTFQLIADANQVQLGEINL